MKVYQHYEFINLHNPVVSVGFFDGVHKGHRNLLAELISVAKSKSVDHLVISMWPHPATIIKNNTPDNFFISTLDEKIDLIRLAGIQNMLVLDFNETLLHMTAEDFIGKIIVENLNASAILMGYNNSLGKGASTRLEVEAIAGRYSLQVIGAERLHDSNHSISSTTIRNFLLSGRLGDANALLGYNYSFEGVVIGGYKIGRVLGYKTANIKPCFSEKIIPGNGVYIVEILIADESHQAILNIGNRPTFEGATRSIEAHIINFDRDIYGDIVTLRFFDKIRDEKKFNSTNALKIQIAKDKQIALDFFNRIKDN